MKPNRIKWLMLALASLSIMGSYYAYDSIAPVASLLRDQRGFSQSQIGWLNAVFNLPNIALALVGGLLIDRFGAARTIVAASAICVIGAVLTAIGEPFQTMLAGRLLFGLGNETLYIALLVGIAQWFNAGGGATATALFFATARLGSYCADKSTSWFADIYAQGWQPPLWLAAAFVLAGMITALVYFAIDRRFEHSRDATSPSEKLKLSDLRSFSPSFWYILWLNVLFASVFFPFRSTFSIQYFQDAKQLNLADAGTANSYVFLAAIFATPVCGMIADRYGRRATLLAMAATLLPVTFALLAFTSHGLWLTTMLMGASFSVIPAVIWPATAMLVDKRRLGAAFGLINMIQSLGLALANVIAGWLNDRFAAGPDNPAGYVGMLSFFGVLSMVALASAIALLVRERRLPGRGIEAP